MRIAPAQGGRHRRRLRPEGRDAQRARRLAALAARLRLLPRGRPRHPGAAAADAAARAAAPDPGAVARPGHARTCGGGCGVIQREWQRDRPALPRRGRAALLGDDRGPQRPLRGARRASRRSSPSGDASKAALEQFLATCAAENPNRRLRMTALADRVSMIVERADFDDLVTLVTQAPTWEKDRAAGVRDPAAGDRRGQGGRARPDPRPLDVAARRGDAEAPGPARERRVPGGEAAARRARELARAPARGERREARQRGARAADATSAPRCSPRPRATRRARTS